MRFIDSGLMSFFDALEMQEQAVSHIAEGVQKETVYLLEHPHVFTAGRIGSSENLLTNKDWEGNPIQVVSTNRGGNVTYHGPGQLIGYPHLDLRQRGRDINGYIRRLEETLILTAVDFKVSAFRRPGLTGVWTQKGKLASIGVGVRRWVTMHGFALNVETDLRYFELIHPCGITDCRMISLSKLLGQKIRVSKVKMALKRRFKEVFGLD